MTYWEPEGFHLLGEGISAKEVLNRMREATGTTSQRELADWLGVRQSLDAAVDRKTGKAQPCMDFDRPGRKTLVGIPSTFRGCASTRMQCAKPHAFGLRACAGSSTAFPPFRALRPLSLRLSH